MRPNFLRPSGRIRGQPELGVTLPWSMEWGSCVRGRAHAQLGGFESAETTRVRGKSTATRGRPVRAGPRMARARLRVGATKLGEDLADAGDNMLIRHVVYKIINAY